MSGFEFFIWLDVAESHLLTLSTAQQSNGAEGNNTPSHMEKVLGLEHVDRMSSPIHTTILQFVSGKLKI